MIDLFSSEFRISKQITDAFFYLPLHVQSEPIKVFSRQSSVEVVNNLYLRSNWRRLFLHKRFFGSLALLIKQVSDFLFDTLIFELVLRLILLKSCQEFIDEDTINVLTTQERNQGRFGDFPLPFFVIVGADGELRCAPTEVKHKDVYFL